MPKLLSNKNFLSLIIISIPFLSFVNTNFYSFNFLFFSSVFFILFFVVIAILLLTKFLTLFQKKLDQKILSFVLSFFFFVLFYLFPVFKDLLFFVAPIYNAEISLIFSIIFLILFLFLFFNQRYKFFKRFILIYLYFCFIAYLGIFILNITIFLSQKIPTDATVLVDEKGIEYSKKNKKKNMYFVIVDAAIALDKFDKHYNTNYFSSYTSKFENLGFNYIKNTKSAYPTTVHNLTSLFYLDYHIDENNYKKYVLTDIFPIILQKKNANKLPLIKNLNKINYKFKWFGNTSYNCEMYNLDFCLEEPGKLQKRTLIDLGVANTFLRRSPLLRIFVKIKSFLGLSGPEIFYDTKKNDSLNEFMNKMDNFKFKNKGYFFFIHHMMPHHPLAFHSDCTLKKGLEIIGRSQLKNIQTIQKIKAIHAQGYKENYECMLKRVNEFVNFINKNDPEANVIITSDHAHDIKDFFYLRYDSFTLVKTNKECQQNVSDNLNTANGARLILGCTVGQKFNFLEKKVYFVNFERGHFSTGGKLRLKKLNPDDYYEFIMKIIEAGISIG